MRFDFCPAHFDRQPAVPDRTHGLPDPGESLVQFPHDVHLFSLLFLGGHQLGFDPMDGLSEFQAESVLSLALLPALLNRAHQGRQLFFERHDPGFCFGLSLAQSLDIRLAMLALGSQTLHGQPRFGHLPLHGQHVPLDLAERGERAHELFA